MASAGEADAQVPWYARAVVLLPAVLFVWFCSLVPQVSGGAVLGWEVAWLPQQGIAFGVLVDGLSLLFALLITGIGSFIFLYASAYMRGAPQVGRFTLFLVAFMLAMLGLVLSDNLIVLFVFWELTTLTSFLLIGYSHEDAAARRSALQGLFVTAAGGLAMLAGFVLLGQAAGTFSLREILAAPDAIRDHPDYLTILILVLAGAFTKSAQFPFHFWLPNAMAAPTPVSAYLHSATMVKAGVFLLARLTPVLGDTEVWMATLTAFGAFTAVYASAIALTRTDLKQVLAYTTLMALGTCVMFLGAPTRAEEGEPSIGLIAAVTFVFVHALYKAALFMVAGSIDHEAGTRELPRLGGLRRLMPLSFAGAVLAAVSMAGLPPFIGFVGKELLYKGALAWPAEPYVAVAAIVAAKVMMVTAALILAVVPFFGSADKLPKSAHEAPWAMWIGPLVLGVVALLGGLLPDLTGEALLLPAAAAVMGYEPGYEIKLWHGVNVPLLLSVATVATGAFVYWRRVRLLGALAAAVRRMPVTGDRAYDAVMSWIAGVAAWQTRWLQGGLQRRYLLTVFLTLGLAVGATLLLKGAVAWPGAPSASFVEWSVAALIVAGTLVPVMADSRLLAICGLSVVGAGVALIFMLFGAPDVAMTQLLVETLVVVIVAIVLLKLPDFQRNRRPRGFGGWRDGAVAGLVGLVTTLTLLAVTEAPPPQEVTEFYERTSVPEGHGRNIVNVILVDFRALDTLGEIAVIAIAGIAAYALIMLRPRRRGQGGTAGASRPEGQEAGP
jgi:multicomponent Na+:H+ antiporter subunit A